MPTEKIQKALSRVKTLMVKSHTTKTELLKLLGSLRHVCTCIPHARPFFQRLQQLSNSSSRYGTVLLTTATHQDLLWFEIILQRGKLQSIPLDQFIKCSPPHVHLYMDASDQGICILHPAERQFILLQFSAEEKRLIHCNEFDINIREQFAIALAAGIFGHRWRLQFGTTIPTVQCWSDNSTTVARTTSLASKHKYSQELNRCIGLSQAIFNFYIRCSHLPGRSNFLADAGSRSWQLPYSNIWSNNTHMWSQVRIPPALRLIYKKISTVCSSTLWPQAPSASIPLNGTNGSDGATSNISPPGSPTSRPTNLVDWLSMPPIAGCQVRATPLPPYCPSLALSSGIIKPIATEQFKSTTATSLHCKGCDGCLPQFIKKHQSQSYPSTTSIPM